jgi:hypothetical protein
VGGYKALKSQLDKYSGELEAAWAREKVSSGLTGSGGVRQLNCGRCWRCQADTRREELSKTRTLWCQ